MTMLRFLTIAVLAALVSTGVISAQTEPAPTLSITLSSPQASVKSGTEIWIDAVTTNLSDHPARIGFLPGPYESIDLSMIVQVRDTHDHPVGPEKMDQSACKGQPNCRIMIMESRPLGSGESIKDHFSLDKKKYDMVKPGAYTVQVVFQNQETHETVKSNILTLTVTP